MVEDVGNIVEDKFIFEPRFIPLRTGRRHEPFHSRVNNLWFRSALQTVPAAHLSVRVFLRAYNTPNDGSITYRGHMDFVQYCPLPTD